MFSSRTPLLPFFFISAVLHLLLLFSRPNLAELEKAVEQIPVSILPESEESKSEPMQTPAKIAARPAKGPGQVAKKSSPPVQEVAQRPPAVAEREDKREGAGQQQRQNSTIVQRPLPTMKDLLPPIDWSPARERANARESAVRLDTREPKYVSYFTSIKRAIEQAWEYPESALRNGLQGKLVMEFTISGNGQLEGTRLIRSSGFSVLDQEAMRAVQSASPFHPIPPWIGKPRLDVVASFEYHDNRLRYGAVP